MKAVYPPAQVAPYDSSSGASPPATRWTKLATKAAPGPTVTPTLLPSRIILWLPYTHTCETELTHLSSLSNTSAVRALLIAYLDTAEYYPIDLRKFDRRWPGTPSKTEI